jgi:hypothetical protein
MLSALLMLRRLVGALRVALREEDFARILGAGVSQLPYVRYRTIGDFCSRPFGSSPEILK